MLNNNAEYSTVLLEFITNRMPSSTIEVFKTIVRDFQNKEICTWKKLVEKFENRSLVEDALLILEVDGFITSVRSQEDRRIIMYIPHEKHGKFLAKYLSENKRG